MHVDYEVDSQVQRNSTYIYIYLVETQLILNYRLFDDDTRGRHHEYNRGIYIN